MPLDEAKLNEAFAAVDEAENFAAKADFAKSVFKFQQALDLFAKCGLPPAKKRAIMDKISDRQAEIARIQQFVREHPEALQEVLQSMANEVGVPAPTPTVPISPSIETPPIITMPEIVTPSPELAPNSQTIEQEGIAALEQANALVQQGRLMEAITKFYEAAEKLIMAGWNEQNLMNIQAEVQRISELLQNQQNAAKINPPLSTEIAPNFTQVQQGTSLPPAPKAKNVTPSQVFTPTFAQVQQNTNTPPPQKAPNPNSAQSFTPTFAQVQQGTTIPPAPKAKNVTPSQVFTPTFAQVQQNTNTPPPQKAPNPNSAQSFTPTFAQVQQGTTLPPVPKAKNVTPSQVFTPTFAQVQQNTNVPQPQKTPNPNSAQSFTPTFAQVQQETILPQPTKAQNPPPNQPFSPTFMQVQQDVPIPKPKSSLPQNSPQEPTFSSVETKAEGVFDPEEFKRMMKATKPTAQAQTTPTFIETGQQDVTPIKAKGSELSSGGPTFLSLENASILSQKAAALQKACKDQQDMLIIMQKEAFDNINAAISLQKEKKIQIAIEKLEEALDMFNSLPGWGGQTTPLYNRLHILQTYISTLGQNPNANQLSMDQIQQQFSQLLAQSGSEFIDEAHDQNVLKWDIQAEYLFKDWINKLNQAQIELFELLDSGINAISQMKWEIAITCFNKCLIILTEIGWVAQIAQIQDILNNLIQIQKQSDSSLTEGDALSVEGMTNEEYKNALQTQYENRRNRIQSLAQQKLQQEEAQKNALKIVEDAENLVNRGQFDAALDKYREAANLLLSTGWQEHLGPINERMNQIRQDRDSLAQKKQDAHKRMLEKQKQEIEYQAQVQKLMVEKQLQMAKQQQSAKAIAEQQSQMRAIQTQISQIIQQADQFANKDDINGAIAKYNEAKTLMQQSGWTEQLSFMDYLINNLEARRKAVEEARESMKLRSEQAKKAQNQFQTYLKEQAEILAREQEAKKQQLENFVKRRDQNLKLQDEAFKLMDAAEKALKFNQFDEAVNYYTKAGEMFKQLGWNIQNIQIQINQVYQLKMQYQQSLNDAALAQQQVVAAQRAAQKQEDIKKQQEMNSLLDIKSMIKQAAQKKDQKATAPKNDARLTDREQMKADLEAWRNKKKTSSSSLRAELMGTSITEQEQVMAEELRKEEKAKSDMDEVREMLKKMSAKKTQDKK